MNSQSEWRAVRIGLLTAGALLVLALAILGITSRQKLFERKVEFYSAFSDAAGLKEGSGVWFQGVEVGFIDRIEFSDDPEVQQVVVRYKISSSLVPRIRSGTRASIKSMGLLGDKYLSLTTPSDVANQPNILPGNRIPVDPTLNLEALGRGAQDVLDNVIEISKNLNELIGDINKGGGAISRLLKDPKMGKETLDHLNRISASLDTIATSIAGGKGFAGKLLVDRSYGDKAAADLAEALASANSIMTRINQGKGGAGLFLAEKREGEQMVADLAKAAASISRVAEAMEKPGTMANKLLMDDEYGDRLAKNLLTISESLASILQKVDRGDGTLGAMVNDREVYDSLASISTSLKESKLIRWYIKRNMEKAAKRAKAEEEGSGGR